LVDSPVDDTMIKSRVLTHGSLGPRGEIAERNEPRWPGFVLSGHRHEPMEALRHHVVGWTHRPRPGVPRLRGQSVN
jgi:hypothetical protein